LNATTPENEHRFSQSAPKPHFIGIKPFQQHQTPFSSSDVIIRTTTPERSGSEAPPSSAENLRQPPTPILKSYVWPSRQNWTSDNDLPRSKGSGAHTTIMSSSLTSGVHHTVKRHHHVGAFGLLLDPGNTWQ